MDFVEMPGTLGIRLSTPRILEVATGRLDIHLTEVINGTVQRLLSTHHIVVEEGFRRGNR